MNDCIYVKIIKTDFETGSLWC